MFLKQTSYLVIYLFLIIAIPLLHFLQFFDSHVIHDRDCNFNYFGFKTLERAYLLKIDGHVAERPQHMFMRVAVGIWGENLDRVLETYNLISEGWFMHASPTLFNSGTPRNQLSRWVVFMIMIIVIVIIVVGGGGGGGGGVLIFYVVFFKSHVSFILVAAASC